MSVRALAPAIVVALSSCFGSAGSTTPAAATPSHTRTPPLAQASLPARREPSKDAAPAPRPIAEALPLNCARVAAVEEQACRDGAAPACSRLGWLVAEGHGTAEDLARAAALFKQACDSGYPRGCSDLAWATAQGYGMPSDYARAAQLYEQACEEGDGVGCANFGTFVADGKGGVVQDYARAAALYDRSCEIGIPAGCFALAGLTQDGLGVARDPARVAALYKRADLLEGRRRAGIRACATTAGDGGALRNDRVPDWEE
jgi:TPR repeat protein